LLIALWPIMLGPMNEVTRILSAIEQGDPHAAAQLLPVVYDELRKLAAQKLAQEKPGQTLQATALVHEAYLRLVASPGRESGESEPKWDSRGHFFAAAAEAMRRILVNHARDKQRAKRGGGWRRFDLDRLTVVDDATPDDLLVLDDALAQLAEQNPACVKLVQLRFFTGLTQEQAAACMGISRRTANRYWAFARVWLYDAIRKGGRK
jgi:RNA polymerase sigma factor (TIGR02999 family)